MEGMKTSYGKKARANKEQSLQGGFQINALDSSAWIA
jgi:hypothetical protein